MPERGSKSAYPSRSKMATGMFESASAGKKSDKFDGRVDAYKAAARSGERAEPRPRGGFKPK